MGTKADSSLMMGLGGGWIALEERGRRGSGFGDRSITIILISGRRSITQIPPWHVSRINAEISLGSATTGFKRGVARMSYQRGMRKIGISMVPLRNFMLKQMLRS